MSSLVSLLVGTLIPSDQDRSHPNDLIYFLRGLLFKYRYIRVRASMYEFGEGTDIFVSYQKPSPGKLAKILPLLASYFRFFLLLA